MPFLLMRVASEGSDAGPRLIFCIIPFGIFVLTEWFSGSCFAFTRNESSIYMLERHVLLFLLLDILKTAAGNVLGARALVIRR